MKHLANCSRRHFLAACCGVAVVGVASPLWGSVRRRLGDPTHPTPRPGITAANVLPDSELVDYPACQSAFDAIQGPSDQVNAVSRLAARFTDDFESFGIA